MSAGVYRPVRSNSGAHTHALVEERDGFDPRPPALACGKRVEGAYGVAGPVTCPRCIEAAPACPECGAVGVPYGVGSALRCTTPSCPAIAYYPTVVAHTGATDCVCASCKSRRAKGSRR